MKVWVVGKYINEIEEGIIWEMCGVFWSKKESY
jgi:hypothetical protein